MAIFGSAARGDMSPDSDVDVLAEFAAGVHYGMAYFPLERELAEVFGRRVDLGTKKWIRPQVKERIMRDARIVYEA